MNLSDYKNIFSKTKLRRTKQRLAILDYFIAKNIPLSAEDVFTALKTKRFDLATIYRTITTFENADIIKKVDTRKSSQYYELKGKHHHHIICTDCGLVEDFNKCGISEQINSILKKSSFKKVTDHAFELFGTCKTCARN